MSEDRRTCYFPDGSVAEDNVPCSSDQYAHCCGDVDLCLSNGLCLNTGHQPYVLSRGGCTSQVWNEECPDYCSDVNPSGGSSIINVAYNKDEPATYCCGTPISVDGSVVCPDDAESFEVASGSVIFDRAILFDSPSSAEEPANTATETAVPGNCGGAPCESCHETVVGAGVGVPLGVIALGSIIWALWERRRTKKQTHAPTQWAADPAKQPYTQNAPTPAVPAAPAELENSTPIHQLMDTERR